MIVEDSDSLRTWLKIQLEPLCDADPSALAKYVLALLKKNTNEEQLRIGMIDQLEVFLQSHTERFVSSLFEILNTKDYLLNNNPDEPSPDLEQKPSSLEEVDYAERTEDEPINLAIEKQSSEDTKQAGGPTVENAENRSTPVSGGAVADTGSVPVSSTTINNMPSSSTSTSSEIDNDEFVSKKNSDCDGMSVNSLDMLKTVMQPSGSSSSDNDSSQSSSSGRTECQLQNKEIRGRRGLNVKVKLSQCHSCMKNEIERKRRRSRSERNRCSKFGRSRSEEIRSESRSPVRPEQNRFRPRDRENHFRRRNRNFSPRRDRFQRMTVRNRSSSAHRRSRTPARYRRPCKAEHSRSPPIKSRSRPRIAPRSDSHSPGPSPLANNSNIQDSMEQHFGKGFGEHGDQPMLKSKVVIPGSFGHAPGEAHQRKPGCSSSSTSASGNTVAKCRDFEEQGLCLRGEMCPYDHGTDPVVLEDVIVPPPAGGQGHSNNPGYGTRSFIPRPRGPYSALGAGRPPIISGVDEYFPENPGLDPPIGWTPPQFRPRPFGFGFMTRGRGGLFFRPPSMAPFPFSPGQRQLLTVPTGSPHNAHVGDKRGCYPSRGFGVRGPGFDHSRLGLRPNRNRANCSLEVRKIPREQNNIMDLNNHFSQFGKIVNIQINFENDPEGALVTFSSSAEAQQAYRSTEAVFNNRFIKVFWHNGSEGKKDGTTEKEGSEQTPPNMSPSSRIPVKDRLGTRQGECDLTALHLSVGVGASRTVETTFSPSRELRHSPPYCGNIAVAKKLKADLHDNLPKKEVAKPNPAQQVQLSAEDQNRLEKLRITSDLRKRLQTMMDEQIANQKKLIAKLESGKLKPEEREETMKVLKSLQESVTKLSKELTATNGIADQFQKSAPKVFKSKEEIQKEILDTEMDLFKEQISNGKNAAELQQKLLELKNLSNSFIDA